MNNGIHQITLNSFLERFEKSDVNLLDLKSRLEDKPYRVIDTGIHPKILADWNRKDLLLIKPQANKMHRFSLTEFVWVKMIEKLRQFNFPLHVIKAFKEDLIGPALPDVVAELPASFLFEQLKDREGVNPEVLKEFLKEVSITEMMSQHLPSAAVNGNLLEVMVTVCLFLQTPLSCLIDHAGKGIVFNPLMLNDGVYTKEDINDLFTSSFVSISLTEVLAEVLVLSDIEILHGQLLLISDTEANVIQALREDELTSVVIRFDKENKMDLMEIQKLQKVERETRLMELMLKDGYQDITLKTQHGKIVYCENTRKVKLK